MDDYVSRASDDGDEPGFQIRDVVRFFMVDVILVCSVRILLMVGVFPNADAYILAILGGKLVLMAYLFWLIRDYRRAWPETGAVTLGRWWGWPAAALAYAAAYPVLVLVDRLNLELLVRVHDWLGWTFAPRIQEAILFVFEPSVGAPVRLTLAIFAVFIGPIMEELAFRGVGFDAYRRRRGTISALVWTSLLFGMYHFSLQLVVPLSAMGALFFFARFVTGSLWGAVAVHCFHNFLALALNARHLGVVDFPWFF